ncbi:MAG: PPOX class F420-dependent oxidoreductase [Actinobacteria bacterium]|nr:PPOX class F420-dependent oxidoreductase [Actinomycetota bacterium]
MTSSALLALADTAFIQLTTFRRSGEPVATPVWVVRDGDRLAVFTQAATGKIKRLRHTAQLTIVACSRRGVAHEGAVPLEARGTVSTDPADVARVMTLLSSKYGLQFRIFRLIEGLTSRGTVAMRAVVMITEVETPH